MARRHHHERHLLGCEPSKAGRRTALRDRQGRPLRRAHPRMNSLARAVSLPLPCRSARMCCKYLTGSEIIGRDKIFSRVFAVRQGTRALHAMGVLDALERLSCTAAGKEVRHWKTGETWNLFDLGAEAIERYGFPYRTVWAAGSARCARRGCAPREAGRGPSRFAVCRV